MVNADVQHVALKNLINNSAVAKADVSHMTDPSLASGGHEFWQLNPEVPAKPIVDIYFGKHVRK